MGAHSDIEWTDASWTPIRARHLATGKLGWHCTHVSEACRFCYAEGINRRLGTGLDFKPVAAREIEIFVDRKMLEAPLGWRKSRMIFVCSMTDLFADFVPDEMIDQVFTVMALASHHTFQVLTKRPVRMRAYFEALPHRNGLWRQSRNWPLPNVWLGTSAEDGPAADERIPHVLATPAAVRFLSLEPLLGGMNIGWALSANRLEIANGFLRRGHFSPGLETLRPIDWVIVGEESGPKRRRMDWDHVRGIRDQCAAAGTAFFFKQAYVGGKKVGLPALDGVVHNAMPAAVR